MHIINFMHLGGGKELERNHGATYILNMEVIGSVELIVTTYQNSRP